MSQDSSGARMYVAVTDYRWFAFLRENRIEEVNFWQPSPINVRAVRGTPWLFKLHSPYNAIAGVGFFTYHSVVPIGLAWETFRHGNGAGSLAEMQQQLKKYKDDAGRYDSSIGCIALTNTMFWDEADWIPQPSDWKGPTQKGKYYSTNDGVGLDLWTQVNARIIAGRLPEVSPMIQRDAYGRPITIRPRLGQGAFRLMVTDAYGRRCAISGERTLPVLEAAHIRPFSASQSHAISNGLLLRSDIHRLFDQGYVTVTPDLTFRVSARIAEQFHNGVIYYELHNKQIALPHDALHHPDREALDWHSSEVYQGD